MNKVEFYKKLLAKLNLIKEGKLLLDNYIKEVANKITFNTNLSELHAYFESLSQERLNVIRDFINNFEKKNPEFCNCDYKGVEPPFLKTNCDYCKKPLKKNYNGYPNLDWAELEKPKDNSKDSVSRPFKITEEAVSDCNENLRLLYLDYKNEFLTVDRLAEHYAISEAEAEILILSGKALHQLHCKNLKNLIEKDDN